MVRLGRVDGIFLTTVPYCTGNSDGSLAKTVKSKSFDFLTNSIMDASLLNVDTLTIEDGNGLFY